MGSPLPKESGYPSETKYTRRYVDEDAVVRQKMQIQLQPFCMCHICVKLFPFNLGPRRVTSLLRNVQKNAIVLPKPGQA